MDSSIAMQSEGSQVARPSRTASTPVPSTAVLKIVDELTDENGNIPAGEIARKVSGYLGAKNDNICLDALPSNLAAALKDMDVDGSGFISPMEILFAVNAFKQQTRSWRKVALALGIVLVIAFVCFTGANFALVTYAFDKAKEVRSREDGVLESNNGRIALVDAASFQVMDDGRLVLRKHDQTCSNNTCRRLADSGEVVPDNIVTGNAPKTQRRLTSVVPDQYLSEMQKMRLQLGNETNPLIKELDVNGFTRKLDAGSQCGSVVDVHTIWGVVTLDDADIYLSLDFKKRAELELDIQIQDIEGPLAAHGLARRLSQGSVIVGLFNYIMDYEWNCESTSKPLAQLQPPYSFTLRTLVWCGASCDSTHFDNTSLPGVSMDLDTSEWEYVEIVEKVIASETEMVSVQTWPNLPGVEVWSHVNLVTGQRVNVKTFTNVSLTCFNDTDNGALTFKDASKWTIAAMGRVQSNGMWFRKFQIFLNDENVKEAARKLATVELWEKSDTQAPYKFFMPNQLEGTSISYFTEFSKEINANELEASMSDIFEDCSRAQNTAQTRFHVLGTVSVLDEKPGILRLYEELYTEGWLGAPTDPYWVKVAEQQTSGRRLASHRRRAGTQEKNELVNMPDLANCPLLFETGKFNMKFCNQREVQPSGVTEDFSVTAALEHTQNFGPVTLTIGGTGAAKVRCKMSQDHCFGAGEIELNVALGVGIGGLVNLDIGGKGKIEVEAPSQTTGAPPGTFKIVGSLTPYGSVDIFGMIQIQVPACTAYPPMCWPGIEVTLDKLGPFPLDDATNKGDDTISIAAKWTVEVNFFFFKFTVSVPITVMPETTIWSATPDMYGQQPWFTRDCELIERTYDRCSHGYIKIFDTYDEKTGEWEPHVQRGAKAYSLVSSSPKHDFRWCCGHFCDEWVRFPRHVNKLVAQLENSDRRVVWVGLLCDRYIEEGHRWHYRGYTDDDCRHSIHLSTAWGHHHVGKHHSQTVAMGRMSGNHFDWHCDGSGRRRGYSRGWHRSGCGRHNYISVGWQDRRRDTAVKWHCYERLGRDRPTSADCRSNSGMYYHNNHFKSTYKIGSSQECSSLCASLLDCWSWSYIGDYEECRFHSRNAAAAHWAIATCGLPSYNCDATLYDWDVSSGGQRIRLKVPESYDGQRVRVSTQGLTTLDTVLDEPCSNDDSHGNYQSECVTTLSSGQFVSVRLWSASKTGSGKVRIKVEVR
jgi:hypothetical protein